MDMHVNKTKRVSARIEPNIKAQADEIFRKMGISSAEAVRVFYTQVCLNKAFPFDIKLPNDETQQALRDVEEGRVFSADSVDDLIQLCLDD